MLTEHQSKQIETAASGNLGLLTGGPGTGKTYSISEWIKSANIPLSRIMCCCPTGKAATRLTESLYENKLPLGATTIHRALQPRMASWGWAFFYGNGNRWKDIDLIIGDEWSMVDSWLFGMFLGAVPIGAKVILVGDPNQLLPVGHGKPFKDLIDSKVVPHGHLTEPHRFSGRIGQVCKAIQDGTEWSPSKKIDLGCDFPENYKHLESGNAGRSGDLIIKSIDRLVSKYGMDPLNDIQVLVPLNAKSGLSRERVNFGLQQVLNPDGERVEDVPFWVGDKVICLKNGVKLLDAPSDSDTDVKEGKYVANGEIGIVRSISKVSVSVRFYSRFTVKFPRNDWKQQLTLAYAITVHKCVHPSTFTETEQGLLPIASISVSGRISSPASTEGDCGTGVRRYENFVHNSIRRALKITTDHGYGITVTPEHLCEIFSSIGYKMIHAELLSVGDWVRMKLGPTIEPLSLAELPKAPRIDVRGHEYRVPQQVDSDVAEFLGLMVADGSVYESGFRLVKRHHEVINRFAYLCRSLFGAIPIAIDVCNTNGFEVRSVFLSRWLILIGGLGPNKKAIPDCILRSRSEIQAAFLRGLFEDGGVNLKGEVPDHIEWSSSYPDMVNAVRQILLRLGIICSRTKNLPRNLYIYGRDMSTFSEKIGFISRKKQKRLPLETKSQIRYLIPVTDAEARAIPISENAATKYSRQNAIQNKYVSRDTARMLLDYGVEWAVQRLQWHWVRITEIEEVQCESMCVEVPYGHRFLQNGFPWGNSQGSQWPAVITVIDDYASADYVCNRPWVYTALSRASKIALTIGPFSRMLKFLKDPGIDLRVTALKRDLIKWKKIL